MRNRRILLTAIVAVLAPLSAQAYDFLPTQLEFATWPAYCKARYMTTSVGRQSEFATAVSTADQRAQEAAIGHETYAHIHHYCAGASFLVRSRLESNPQTRAFMVRRAIAEGSYTFRHIPENSPLYSTVAAHLAMSEHARGKQEVAKSYFDKAMQADPADPRPYLGLSILYRDNKEMPLARETLEKGLTATNGESIEIHYNLGLVCLELKDNDCALKHAQAAYAGGYPFPALKQKLDKLGLWKE